MDISLFIKVIYWIQIMLKKINYFILFFSKIYFFDEQSKFLILQFYWNKQFKNRFIYEQKSKSVQVSSG